MPNNNYSSNHNHYDSNNPHRNDFNSNHAPPPLPRGRGRGRGRGRAASMMGLNSHHHSPDDRSMKTNIHHMNRRHESESDRGMGRGRGRGRGINTPAWMKDDRLQRQHQDNHNGNSDRHQQQSRREVKSQPQRTESKALKSPSSSSLPPAKSMKPKDIPIDPEEQRLREEMRRQEEREEQELKSLAAQFDDANENDNDNIRNHGDSNIMFAFETDQEKEERLSKERRERRRKRLREVKVQMHSEDRQEEKKQKFQSPNEKVYIEVDRPRNADGIIASEKESGEQFNMAKGNSYKGENNENGGNGIDGGTSNANGKDKADGGDSGVDSFDMFSSSVSPPSKSQKKSITPSGGGTGSGAGLGTDDAEGYYRATIGEIVSFSLDSDDSDSPPVSAAFRVQGIIGKGVFSTVLKCVLIQKNNLKDCDAVRSLGRASAAELDIVAMKLIRSNETMAKAAQKEVRILRLLNTRHKRRRDKNGNGKEQENYIVRLLELEELDRDALQSRRYDHNGNSSGSPLLEYQNHAALLFEHLPFNLRETLSKFGKNVGINLAAIRSYAKQLLTALKHLAQHRVVHADIKLDNILVSANFSTVKLCDFGSAFFETDSDNDPTPYLVSRFYRAPEIMLGLEYDKMIDLWSVAVSLAELFTGNVLYPGRNNNDMLKKFMESTGPFSNKMIRRHVASFTHLGLQPHFEAIVIGGNSYNFRRQDFDKVTGTPVIRLLEATSGSVTNLSRQTSQVLLRSRSSSDGRGDVLKFGEFLSRCLALDPVKRIGLDDALNHEFFVSKKKTKIDSNSED